MSLMVRPFYPLMEVQYTGFAVDGESEGYAAHYTSVNPKSSALDGFGADGLDGRPFCTADRDCGGCALAAFSGWWFGPTCSPESSLNSPYGNWASTYPSAPRLKWNVSGITRVLDWAYFFVESKLVLLNCDTWLLVS
jgi:hypothetical protein